MIDRRDAVRALLADRGGLVCVAGLGGTSWDVAAAGDCDLDLPLWGSMGAAAMVGFGIALGQPDRPVLVVTGDGEQLMALGALATIAAAAPANLTIAVLDNERYGETGAQADAHRAGHRPGGGRLGLRLRRQPHDPRPRRRRRAPRRRALARRPAVRRDQDLARSPAAGPAAPRRPAARPASPRRSRRELMSGLDDLASLVRDDGVVLGAAPAAPYRQAEAAILDRRARGLFADMRFTMQQPERSCHPETALRGARTVVSALIEVWQPEPERPEGAVGRLPRYAWGDPYDRLRSVAAPGARRAAGRRARGPPCSSTTTCTSTGPAVTPRASPSRARTRWRSRPASGSFVALGAVITDAALVAAAPEPVRDGCGSCTLCIDACPTGALDEPGVLDSTRCLSYWTQSRADAPADVADALEDRVYGCDICQDVCPWNAGPAKRRADAPTRTPRPSCRWPTG